MKELIPGGLQSDAERILLVETEDDVAPLTEIRQSWVMGHRGYETISRAIEGRPPADPDPGSGEH